jgi:hypothetical protein
MPTLETQPRHFCARGFLLQLIGEKIRSQQPAPTPSGARLIGLRLRAKQRTTYDSAMPNQERAAALMH